MLAIDCNWLNRIGTFYTQGFLFIFVSLLPVGQKTVVVHHFKMLRRDMTDIAPDHLFLRQRLLPVLLRPVVVIVVHYRAAAVVWQARKTGAYPLQCGL